ncbi:MAG: hypothetical protein WB767_00940 [Nocardioides sp.]
MSTSVLPIEAKTHEHDWRLRSVEFEDNLSVQRYECADCLECRFAG